MKTHYLAATALLLGAATLSAADPCPSAGHRSCCATETPASPFTGQSLYQLDATWTNDNGQPTTLGALKGRPQIVVMFFANCNYACPLLVQQMKQIEEALPEAARTNTGFLLVSFDPERDTPAALRQYRLSRQLDARRWTLLRGEPGDVLDLAALLGIKFKKDAQGQFLHSNVITLLNGEGEIAYQQTGLNSDSREMIRRARQLAAPAPAHAVARTEVSE